MPNDAKLGMVAGVSLVIVFAVLFFRKEVSPDFGPGVPRAVTPAPRMSGGGREGAAPVAPARPANRTSRAG